MLRTKPNQATPEFGCLILEDDLNVAELFAQTVNSGGGRATVAGTIAHASSLVATEDFDVFVLDHKLPDGKGSDFFAWLREQGTAAPCIMLTGAPEIQLAVELTRNGLFDYLTKPVELGHLLDCVRRAVGHGATQSNLQGFGLVDVSRGMGIVRQLVRQAAANPRTTILLTGETGVGKDVIARLIHQLTFEQAESSPPMISLNCSTLPADMFEAELFGATKGAYTGAHQNRTGLAQAAQGGTLFLDEIGEVPLSLQAKLLQFLETREYRRLGHTETLHFDGRIIAATNKSLEAEVQAGTFRADLRYRLDVFNIHIPPLRERQEDIVPLVEFLLDTICRRYERPRPIPNPDDLVSLQDYDFPGNVRELRNIIERSLLQTPVDARWLEMDRGWLRRTRSAVPAEKAAPATPVLGRSLSPLEQQEYTLIRKTLVEEKGHIRRTATKLGMSHQALLRRLGKWPELRAA